MTTSKRLAEKKVAKFQKNITKRGSVLEASSKKGSDYPVGPIVVGFFVFVVVGSCIVFCPLFIHGSSSGTFGLQFPNNLINLCSRLTSRV